MRQINIDKITLNHYERLEYEIAKGKSKILSHLKKYEKFSVQ